MKKKINSKIVVSVCFVFIISLWSAKCFAFYLYPPAINYANIIFYDTTQNLQIVNHHINNMSISLADISYTLNLIAIIFTIIFLFLVFVSFKILKQYKITYAVTLLFLITIYFIQPKFDNPSFVTLIPFSIFGSLRDYLLINGMLWLLLAIMTYYYTLRKLRHPNMA